MLILHLILNVSRAKDSHDFSIMFETDLNLFEILFNPCLYLLLLTKVYKQFEFVIFGGKEVGKKANVGKIDYRTQNLVDLFNINNGFLFLLVRKRFCFCYLLKVICIEIASVS